MKKKVKAKSKVKAKVTKRVSQSKAAPEQAGLAEFMARIEQRLEVIDQKIEALFHQMPAEEMERSPRFHRSHAPQEPEHRASQPAARHSGEPAHPKEDPPQPQHNANPVPAHSHKHKRGKKGRPSYKAVCADCRKDCEVPFQPTAQRPVYCKECFSKRKSGGGQPKFPKGHAAPHDRKRLVTA